MRLNPRQQIGFGIVGLGQAGQARQRCIEAHPQTRLVVICTENALHPMQVEQALRAGSRR